MRWIVELDSTAKDKDREKTFKGRERETPLKSFDAFPFFRLAGAEDTPVVAAAQLLSLTPTIQTICATGSCATERPK